MEENNITVDKAVQTIKGAILRAQAQASQSSNAIQLSLYYGIGRYVSINLQQAHWGAKALDTISERLQRELQGFRGFSSGNVKKMRIFYEEWQCLSIGSPMANQLQQLENKIEATRFTPATSASTSSLVLYRAKLARTVPRMP